MNTDQLHADTRSCGELSCEECNERTEALSNEIARLTSELSALQTECDHLRITRAEFKKKVTDVEAEKEQMRSAIKVMLASAHPHPVEHPGMFAAWTDVREGVSQNTENPVK